MPLARDTLGHLLQLLTPVRCRKISVVTATARTAADFTEGVIAVELIAAEDCYVKFGGATVEATTDDVFVAKLSPVIYPVNHHTRLAAIRASADGTLHINELR